MPQITQPIPLGTTHGRQAAVTFDAELTTSDAGTLLLRRIDDRLGVCGRLAGAIQDPRNLLLVTHPLVSLLRQRTFQIAMGWEDAADADNLRSDPAFKLVCGRLPAGDQDLAGQSTLSRLENRVTEADLERGADALLDVYLAKHAGRKKRRLITLDADVSDVRTHGNQEQALYNAYYGHTCYTPLFVFDGDTDDLLAARLRPGNAGTGDGLLDELERIVPRLKSQWPKARIRLRADAGFGWPGIFDFCDRHGLEYLVGFRSTPALKAKSAADLAEATLRAEDTGCMYKYYGSGTYRNKSWGLARRVVWKAEAEPGDTDLRFVVTNLTGTPTSVYRTYCRRGESENWIKAFKSALQGDRLSCQKVSANAFRLLLHAAAYQLMLGLRDLLADTVAERWQFDTLRLRLLKVGGWIRQTAHRITLHLSAAHPHQDLWALLIRRTAPA